jgi:hypothetical protein
MSIVFASPLVLFGLIAGAIPLIIHRLTHQKTVKKRFSAVRLLIRSQKTVARPQRLKHLILLALRIAAIVAVILMAARPTLVRPGLLAFGGGGTKAIIVDNSMSMGYRDGADRYSQAIEAARTIVNDLSGRGMIIPTVARKESAAAEDSGPLPPQEALRHLTSLNQSEAKGDPVAAIGLAFERLRSVPGQKEVILISDLARGDWQSTDQAKLGIIPADGRLTVLRIGSSRRDANSAVKDVRAGSGSVFAGSPYPVTARLANLSDAGGQIAVRVLIDGVRADQRTLLLKPGEEGTAPFRIVTNRSGWHNGEVHVAADNLAADDVFHFPLYVREKGRIAVIDGDPRPAMRESESYFLTRALLPGDAPEGPLEVRVFHESEFQEKDLSAYDQLFLLNVRRPSAARISAFLNAGKSVFVFLGDRVVPEDYNTLPLFPWKIRTVREFGEKPERISRIDHGHAALAAFGGGENATLAGTSFSRVYRVEGGAKPLLSLGNGDPLLLESSSGKGRLYLFASSADLDWNDLPLAAGYVPLLQGLVKSALAASEPAALPAMRVGETVSGGTVMGQVTGQQGGAGIYRVSVSGSGETRMALNAPFDESDLTKMTAADLKNLLPGIALTVTEYRRNGEGGLLGSRRVLWPYLLGFLLLVLAAEMGVTQKL